MNSKPGDGLDARSVQGHHLVTAACGGAHLRARVVDKNQTDRMDTPPPPTGAQVLSYQDLVRAGEGQAADDSVASTETVQGSIHVHPDAHREADEAEEAAERPGTPPPPARAHARPGAGTPGPATRSPGARAAASSPPSRRKPAPRSAGTPTDVRGLADSSLDSNGLGGGDESLDVSMLSSSIGSASAAATNALMLTMGKMKKKEGHGMMAKLRSADCWIEDNLFKVRCEDDAETETWDLGQCKVVPPSKLDRIKLQMTSGSQGLRELNLHSGSKVEAQQWLRAIVARQEVISVQKEFGAILKRMQEAHERKQRQLSHQIEILTRSSDAWEDECSSLSQQVDELQREVLRWQSTYADLNAKHDKSERQAQALEEEVRMQQVNAAARAEDVQAQIEEAREEANAQVELLLEECQELQQKLKAAPPGDYVASVDKELYSVLNTAEEIEAQLATCISCQQGRNLEAARQQQKMEELSATVQAVLLNHEGDVEGFCRIPVQVNRAAFSCEGFRGLSGNAKQSGLAVCNGA